uniref:COPIIcoated_ERV domain-containing protein n=1 Tax=Parastrongyloides trichosuri TaxID=131310 RepID=A0A0N4ZBX9_PARTI
MKLPEQGLRKRRGFLEVIQEFDSFNKVEEKVKEEKNAAKGFVGFLVIGCIIFLILGHTYDRYYGHKQYIYSMNSADYAESFPKLTLDMQLATSCGNFELSLPESNVVSQIFGVNQDDGDSPTLNKDPTRFELSETEYKYWKVLQEAHRKKYNNKDSSFNELNDIDYVNTHLEQQLREAADIKQEEEERELAKGRADNKDGVLDGFPNFGGNQIVMFGNGIGMFQVISSNSVNNPDEGTACRIHGELEIKKMQSESISIIIGGGNNQLERMIAHMQGSVKPGNSSHRIESLFFGDKTGGMITPLAGVEEISMSGKTVYSYSIKVIPTRIYHGSLFSSSSIVYQYAVTSIKREPDEEVHSHGGIIIDYELTGTVIEIKESTLTKSQFFLRLCSIIGGIYATVTFLSVYISKLLQVVGSL